MEVDGLTPSTLGLLLLPLLAVLLIALCVRCHEPPDSYESAPADSSNPTSILIKPPVNAPVPWTPGTSYPPVISYPPPSQPESVPIPRSPQPPVGSHRMPPSQQDSDGANSMASYENQEPACEDADEEEDEDDYHNPGYLVVLPDSTPATSTAVPSAPVPSDPGLRDSTFSMEDYVNVPESGESAEASLDGSREYVNVSQELESETRTKLEVGDEEEEGLPDYENLQELN